MKELIRLLDKNLPYERHEIKDDEIHIRVKSKRKYVECPYCGEKTKKVHSRHTRKIQDMPISGKKVYIEIANRKMFCVNTECTKKTFAERHEFVREKGKKSRRLEAEIINIAMNNSSMASAKMLRRNTVKVSAGTIRNLLKKMRHAASTENQ